LAELSAPFDHAAFDKPERRSRRQDAVQPEACALGHFEKCFMPKTPSATTTVRRV